MKHLVLRPILTAAIFSALSANAVAQTTEEQFQDIFITAGYAAAFGASLGAASLAFYDNPEEHLRDVAVGASLGFIGGSLFGTYIVLSPVLADGTHSSSTTLAASSSKPGATLSLSPVFDKKTRELSGMGAGFKLTFN